ncbi:hypothetical protein CLV59_106120 [Chitinophaga dinghuensis]|uniref:Uncharacterized protein n=1 Tax=Chitinophaga dinghuensis TaxID=1539050 RepID=A0A327VUY1_9BACT|nr:hypothetical protein [Chitinophaga dinghuensis]RAJ79060.1 hypothetical protein CLV59_106120 [Chitinophaga dinghuensis]
MKGLLLAVLVGFQLTTFAQGQVPAAPGKVQPQTPAPTTNPKSVNGVGKGESQTLAPSPSDSSPTKRSGLLFRPATIDFRLSPGQTGIGKVLITSAMPVHKQFTIYTADFVRDSAGGHVYTAGGSIPQSCAKWIKLDKTFFEIDSGQTVELPFKLVAPEDSLSNAEMKWAMIFLETTQEQIVETADGVRTKVNGRMRVGVHIYQTPPGITEKDVEIQGFQLPKDSNRVCLITCKNTGRMQLEINSYIELSNNATNERTKVYFPLFPMFPGQVRIVPFQLPDNLPKGKYSLIGVIDAGGDVPIAAVQENIDM